MLILGKLEKLILKLLSATSDKNFQFLDLILLLNKFDFKERNTGGSHRIFYKLGVDDIINIQPDGNKAKPYQVKQVRNIFIKYKLLNNE